MKNLYETFKKLPTKLHYFEFYLNGNNLGQND